MKILVVGDPHYKKDNSEETDLLESEIDRIITKEKPDELVILGDVMDRFSLRPKCRAVKWLLNLSNIIPVTVLIGNHERENNTDFQSAVHHFVGLDRPNLTIVSSTIHRDNIAYVPYVANGRFAEALGNVGKTKLIFAHQSFVGCQDPGATDEWKSKIPIISGHIHHRIVLHSGDKSTLSGNWNVYYPGAPLCNNFGDEPNRYVCTVDTVTLKVKELSIAAKARISVTLTPSFSKKEALVVSNADKYTRIIIVGSFSECSIMTNSTVIREAQMKGAQIITRPWSESSSVELKDAKLSFIDAILTRMKDRTDEEGLAYLSSLLK
jgi:predicted phosphodiesterase